MRNCGVGHTGLEKFCGLMNMPQPMTRKNVVISNKVRDSAEVAKASMLTRCFRSEKWRRGDDRHRCNSGWHLAKAGLLFTKRGSCRNIRHKWESPRCRIDV